MTDTTIPADALEAAMREILTEQNEASDRASKEDSNGATYYLHKGSEHAYDQSIRIIRRHCRHFLGDADV